MEKSTTYVLVYVVGGKAVVKGASSNYAYIKRKKELYDKALNRKGAIKKVLNSTHEHKDNNRE